jgi:hypothetical protein
MPAIFNKTIFVFAFLATVAFVALWLLSFYLWQINFKPIIILLPFILTMIYNLLGYNPNSRTDIRAMLYTLLAFIGFHVARYWQIMAKARHVVYPGKVLAWEKLMQTYHPGLYLVEKLNTFDLIFLLLAMSIAFSLNQAKR